MRGIVLSVVALLAIGNVAAADPIGNFFDYHVPRAPASGDCAAIAAAIGPEATWYGEFSGTRVDDFSDYYYPYAARGCFKSEAACRFWQGRSLTYLGRGYLLATSCRQGIRRF